MTIQRSKTEVAVWGALAFAGGWAAGWLDLRAIDVQSPAIVLMLITFALTLPGRAPVSVVAIASLGFPIMRVIASRGLTDLNAGYFVVLIPAFIGAGGGRLAGSLLDTASRRLNESSVRSDAPWTERPLTTRFILALALVIIAAVGLPSATAALSGITHASPWVGMVWEIMTLLGWIGITPMLLDERPLAWRTTRGAAVGLTPVDVATHLLLVAVLTVIHAAAIVALSGLLFIPLTPNWHTLALTAFTIYLPLDLLAYVTILTLGFASDVERQRRDSAQREAAMQAESLNSRLAALRARLNPHFLFNALNSVHVLARAGKPEETVRGRRRVDGSLAIRSRRAPAHGAAARRAGVRTPIPRGATGALRRATSVRSSSPTHQPATRRCRNCCFNRSSRMRSNTAWLARSTAAKSASRPRVSATCSASPSMTTGPGRPWPSRRRASGWRARVSDSVVSLAIARVCRSSRDGPAARG